MSGLKYRRHVGHAVSEWIETVDSRRCTRMSGLKRGRTPGSAPQGYVSTDLVEWIESRGSSVLLLLIVSTDRDRLSGLKLRPHRSADGLLCARDRKTSHLDRKRSSGLK